MAPRLCSCLLFWIPSVRPTLTFLPRRIGVNGGVRAEDAICMLSPPADDPISTLPSTAGRHMHAQSALKITCNRERGSVAFSSTPPQSLSCGTD